MPEEITLCLRLEECLSQLRVIGFVNIAGNTNLKTKTQLIKAGNALIALW